MIRAFLAENPQHPQGLYSLAQVAIKAQNHEASLTLLAQASCLMPERHEPLLQLAEQMAGLARFEHAEACYQRLLAKFPDRAQCCFAYAGYLVARGHQDEALKYLHKSVELDPSHVGALLALSGMKRVDADSALMRRMESLLMDLSSQKVHDEQAKMELHYALGKVFDDQNNYAKAFEHWSQANQLQLDRCHFRFAQMRPFFEELKSVYEAIGKHERAGSGPAKLPQSKQKPVALVPIFILGMPRTGSTLLEQMLCAHPQIQSAGEVNYLAKVVVADIERMTQKNYPQGVIELKKKQFEDLGDNYCKKLQAHYPEAHFIIDKLPANFQSVGLIQQILPGAKIVHLKRDPIAVGFSIFRSYFSQNEPYFCDLDEYVEYYLAYEKLMAFWRENNADNIVELDYEKLIKEPRIQLSSLLNSCGLEWHEECLMYYQKKNYITTLSHLQVREPIYRNANEKWQQYAKFLMPLKAKLEDSF